MFDEIYNWLFLKYGLNVPKKFLKMFFVLAISFVILLIAVIINGGMGTAVPPSANVIPNPMKAIKK